MQVDGDEEYVGYNIPRCLVFLLMLDKLIFKSYSIS
jgi:hypothetical protein